MQDMMIEEMVGMDDPMEGLELDGQEEQQEEMLDLSELPPDQFVQFVTEAQNIAEFLPDDELKRIGGMVVMEYDLDKESMDDWLKRMEKGVDLAKLTKKEKNYPFTGSANIKYPLITSAAMQFNARAYPAIVPATNVVKVQTYGSDPQGMKAARGERVSEYMSYQLSNRVKEWEEQTDSLLVQLPIVGTMVRKVWFDTVKNRPCFKLLDAGAFIVNDKVKNLDDAPRMSEEMYLYPNEIESRVRIGDHIPIEVSQEKTDPQASIMFIEQHRLLDLDDDGYEEPYIVTVHHESQQVVRIVADFMPMDVAFETEQQSQMQQVPEQDPLTGEVYLREVPAPVEVPVAINGIQRGSFFVAYHFLPALDGGFWGTGLGLLLGDISETINTIMNMLLDAGHYASLGGGFIGSEFRIKGGAQRMGPGEWRQVNSNGQDVRSAIVPLQVNGPDATLYSMLGMLIEAGREIASVKDVITGDSGGQQMTATTTLALIEQGMTVFTAAYKRIFRSLKDEYKLLGSINAETVTPEDYNAFLDDTDQQGQPVMHDPQADFGAADMDICPVADPRSVTKMQEAAKAELLRVLAGDGLVDPAVAGQRILEAASIGDVEELAPKPNPVQEQLSMMQVQAAQADLAQKMADIELTMAKVESERAGAIKDLAGAELDKRTARIDAILKLLEMQRDGLAQTLKDQSNGAPASAGGLAGQPGNGGIGQLAGGAGGGIPGLPI